MAKMYETESAEATAKVVEEMKTTKSPKKSIIPKDKSFKDKVAEAKEKAFKKRKVVISSNDTRTNNVESAIVAFCENKYFKLDKIVPLNIPCELEQCLIDTLKDVMIPTHTPEIKNGKNTGNSKMTMIRKYNISYEE